MKKTKLLGLASLLLVAGLVGCTSGEKPSSEASSEEPTSETTTEETPVTTETTPVTTETTPVTSGSYETTASLKCVPATDITDLVADVKDGKSVLIESSRSIGDFTFNVDTSLASDKMACFQANSKSYNGVDYASRLNIQSNKHTFTFTAAKAGKLVLLAQSSNKEQMRPATLQGPETVTGNLPVSGNDMIPLEMEFKTPGTYTFSATGDADGTVVKTGGFHFWAAYVYYVA